MDKVKYLKLAELYAAFLIAIGGVSITALALVLNLSKADKTSLTALENESRAFLIAALIVATVSCFIGAHMMAETAAFIANEEKPPPERGKRLFVLGSTNIFVAALLVLFSLALLPAASGEKNAALMLFSITVFACMTAAILLWLWLAARFRMHVEEDRCRSIRLPFVIGIVWFVFLCMLSTSCLLVASFTPIVFLTVFMLGYFAWHFAHGETSKNTWDVFFFCLTIFISCASLLAAVFRIVWKYLTTA